MNTKSVEQLFKARFPHASSVNALDAGSGWFRVTVVTEGGVSIIDTYEIFIKAKRTQTKIVE